MFKFKRAFHEESFDEISNFGGYGRNSLEESQAESLEC